MYLYKRIFISIVASIVFLPHSACELFTPRVAEPPLPEKNIVDYFNFNQILRSISDTFTTVEFSGLFGNNFTYEHRNDRYHKDEIKNRLEEITQKISDSTMAVSVEWFADTTVDDPIFQNRDFVTIYRKYTTTIHFIKDSSGKRFRGSARFNLRRDGIKSWFISYWKDIPENDDMSFFHPNRSL